MLRNAPSMIQRLQLHPNSLLREWHETGWDIRYVKWSLYVGQGCRQGFCCRRLLIYVKKILYIFGLEKVWEYIFELYSF